VGPADFLSQLDIRPVCDLPAVGAHLNDHPDIVIQHRCRQPVSIYRHNHGLGKVISGLRWFLRHDGIAASNHFEAGGFIRSRPGVDFPDLQLTFMPLAIQPGSVRDVGCHSYQVHIDLMRPRSRGQVRIRSCDPALPPSIVFNYLQDPQDREDLRASVRLTREILAQAALTPFAGEELSPGPALQADADIDAFVRRGVETCYHPVGTCRMGASQDSVVDAECRVYGTTGLRVVDASIMPSIVSGNTNAPTIMMAEKASDLIRGKAAPPKAAAPVWIHPHWETAQR
jgi:choline dehydrogenase